MTTAHRPEPRWGIIMSGKPGTSAGKAHADLGLTISAATFGEAMDRLVEWTRAVGIDAAQWEVISIEKEIGND